MAPSATSTRNRDSAKGSGSVSDSTGAENGDSTLTEEAPLGFVRYRLSKADVHELHSRHVAVDAGVVCAAVLTGTFVPPQAAEEDDDEPDQDTPPEYHLTVFAPTGVVFNVTAAEGDGKGQFTR